MSKEGTAGAPTHQQYGKVGIAFIYVTFETDSAFLR